MTALGVVLLGAVGALARHLVGHWSSRRGGWPRGTLVVNMTGSLLAGLVLGASAGDVTTTVLVAGFCGGFTTFSTWSVEVVELGEAARQPAAWLYGLGSAAACVLAAWLGLFLTI